MDNQTRFFKSSVLLQFIPVALLGVFLYSKFERQEIANIREFHPNELNLGVLFPIIFFVICSLISIPYLFSKKNYDETEENEIQKSLRIKNFWKFSFYANALLVAFILVYFGIINLQHPKEFIVRGDEIYYLFVFFQALIPVLLSLILASFMLTSGVYWKTNKALASITLFLGFFFFGTFVLFDFLLLNEFKKMSTYHYQALEIENGTQETPTVVEEEFDESQYQEDESREDQVEEIEIEAAWNYFLTNKYDLKGKQEFTEIRFPMYSNFLLNTEEDGDYFLTGYVKEIRKDPEAIKIAFQTYKYVLYSSVSKRTYRIANFDKVIDGLLFTYEDLFDSENEGNLQKIYKVMTAEREGYGLDAGEYYPELEKYFTPETIELLESTRLSNGSQFSNGDIVWFYSFWARRNHENNSDEVVAVLREIQENYN